ncbi:hypothetical protein [Mycolicibacterium alvei]|jgi:hypothetical protein|uniref:DUF2613 domain-containing protein n=1 Tax=Mycolicibacterium alvei TaxID=67081 RepID=A0A6N4UWA5_9MYCO|nr:hypothetical protein [Mycolicibacterium alvei]MCV7000573.1 hypothetical protein [Mycolicibacterium alvei]BBX27934.1 hypothetical protein MALV_30590 [Mycolicibacterium alvei]
MARINTLAAAIGGSAVVAMGILALTLGGPHESPTAIAYGGSMTIGQTTTVTYTGTVSPASAAPAVKAPPYGKH